MILYLHGFRSSPASAKAQQLLAEMAGRGWADRIACPALSHVPTEAIAQAEAVIAANAGQVTLIGSSLGGFYATWLAEKHGLRAALVNPAVLTDLPPDDFLGPHSNLYTDEVFEFTMEHVEQLRSLDVLRPTPARYLLLLEKGDEVLDWRKAAVRYAGAEQFLVEGGDHGFSRFAEYLPKLLAFAGLIAGYN
jgi:predicted esterase YcpF (UPF0227 family)